MMKQQAAVEREVDLAESFEIQMTMMILSLAMELAAAGLHSNLNLEVQLAEGLHTSCHVGRVIKSFD